MVSKASDVPAYIDEVPSERRAAINKLRGLCRQTLTGYEEGMEYGMPCYKRNGFMEVAFASQKQHIALYMMKKDVLDEFRGELSASSTSSIGKGCIRFAKPTLIDFQLVERLLQRTAESESTPC